MPNPKTFLKRTSIACAALLATLLLGAVYEKAAEHRDRANSRPSGSLVDLGGYRLHLHCSGSGSPTVLLEAGMGDHYLHWRLVQEPVSTFTRVCSYDRAGLGWSDPSPDQRDSATIARELHTLLERSGTKPPYILVGHSFGGMYVRAFRGFYPAEVQSMILVDSTYPGSITQATTPAAEGFHRIQDSVARRSWLLPFGIVRLARLCGSGPSALEPELRAIECRSTALSEQIAELDNFGRSAEQARASGTLGDLPLIVISEDAAKFMASVPGAPAAFDAKQDDLMHLSSRGCRIIATGSDHQVMMQRPDVIIEAIRRMVQHTDCEHTTIVS